MVLSCVDSVVTDVSGIDGIVMCVAASVLKVFW